MLPPLQRLFRALERVFAAPHFNTRAIDDVTGGADHPAQTILGVTGLAVPGLLIEIECTAVTAS